MEYLIGALLTSMFFLYTIGVFFIGRNSVKDKNISINEKVKKRDQGMQNIMDYDVDVAMGKRTQRGDE